MKRFNLQTLLPMAVFFLVIGNSPLFAQGAEDSAAAREEAVERVRETMREMQSMQDESAPSVATEPGLIVEDVTPAVGVAAEVVPKTAQGTSSVIGESQHRFPFFPSQSKKDIPANKVSPSVSKDAKQNFYKSAMTVSPLSFRDMVSIMAMKKRVADGVSYDDAVEAMMFRANEVNFKNVGVNKLWLDVRAITGDENTPRVEIYQFCDAMVARKILDYSPEFVIFLPCRIALIEDGEGAIWVMSMDWDITWLDYAQNPNSALDKELREDAIRIRNAIEYIMDGAATGDF